MDDCQFFRKCLYIFTLCTVFILQPNTTASAFQHNLLWNRGKLKKKKNALTTGKGELMPPQCSVNFISYLSLETSQMCNVHLAIKLPIRQLLSSQQRASVSHVWWHRSFGGGRWWWVLGTAGRLPNASHQDHWALKDNALSETV